MTKLKIYKLHFTSPVHLGDARDDYSVSLQTIASDTMYAALTSCLAKMGKNIPENGDLGFTISSLFPFYQKDANSKAVYFFPKPLKQVLPTSEKAIQERKKIKKVAWLDTQFFSKALKGEQLFNDSIIDSLNNGIYLTNEKIDKNFITSQVSPRVKVSRDGQDDATPFYMDRIMFKDSSGLYFIVEGNTELLDNAMDLLQSEGIGTDRNIGNGFFEYETDNLELQLPEKAEFAMSLSQFIPQSEQQIKEMLDSNEIAYDFQRRGGWVTTPPHNTIRKNFIYAFTSGSVFKQKISDLTILGKIVDLKPELPQEMEIKHPIWRSGKALFLPIKLS